MFDVELQNVSMGILLIVSGTRFENALPHVLFGCRSRYVSSCMRGSVSKTSADLAAKRSSQQGYHFEDDGAESQLVL